ncbi:hypothetical protein BDB01DRAFT_113994 [Pilobolus umbonatus]|nr:hypothetical protein BDB01DRAFT_113994 [Pilobolus umbonatus]
MTSNFKEACMHLYNDHKLVHPNSILDTLIGYLPLLKFTKANPVWSHKIHNSPIGQQLSKMNCAEVKQFCMESGIPIECIEECITMIPTEKLSPTVTSILRIFHDITMCIDHPIYKQNILDQPSFIQLLSPDVPFMVIRHSLRLIQCLLQYNSSSLQFKNPSAITDLIEHFTTLLNMPKSIINQNEVNILSTEILAVLDRILLISNNSPIAGKIFELVMRLLYSEELRVNGIKILIRTHTQVELDPDVIFRQRIMGSLLYLMSTIILARPDIIRNNKSYTPYSLYFYVQKLLSYKDQVISSGFEETIDLLESSQSALANLLK